MVKNESRDAKRSGGTGKIVIALAVIAVVVAGIILWSSRPDNLGNVADVDDSEERQAAEQLDLTRRALAATENLEAKSADKSWESLYQQSPGDKFMLQNRALNRILNVDELAGQASNSSLEAAAKQAARAQLPDAIAATRLAIEQYATESDDKVLPVWMKARIDLQEASLLPGSMTKSLRREIFERLSETLRGELGKLPSARILGGSLIEVLGQMEDPIDGLPAATMKSAAETVKVLSDSHPDNLYFALRAARLNIDIKNANATELVKRTGELARAIAPLVGRETRAIGMTPAELVTSIVDAIGAGEWPTAETRMSQWFNVLNGTEIVKTDRRLALPHPLDRLSFESLRRLSSLISQKSQIERGKSPLVFESVQVNASEKSRLVTSIDFDVDLDSDIVTVDDQSIMHAYRNDGDAKFVSAGSAKLPLTPAGIVVADLFVVDSSSPSRIRSGGASVAGRHDTLPCLVMYGDEGVTLACIDGREATGDDKRFILVDEETGLESVTGVTFAVAGDLEADGDLDLVFATKTDGVRMFVNRGNRTFFELDRVEASFGKSDPVTCIAAGDLDRDLDLDLVTTHASGKVGMLENLLHLQFRGRFLDEIKAVPGASQIAIEDVDGNVSWDLIVSADSGSTIVYSQTAAAGAWTVERTESTKTVAAPALLADFDNDSWLDLITDAGISTIGPWGFDQRQGSAVPGFRGNAADFNADGLQDFPIIDQGKLSIAINQTAASGHFVNARFKGIDDNASGRVNHFAIGSVLEMRFGPHYRARIVTSPSTHFGIDGFDDGATIRAILPNGLTQTIRDIKADTLVEEEQTLKGSCPYLYAWDGSKFRFVTDCLWAAPLGLQVADGIVAKDRPWEYLKIDGTHIRPRDDRYEFRLTEELWEVAYFDEVAITAVDHPSDVDIWTNEKVGPADIATPTIFAFDKQQRRQPTLAIDTNGRDVTGEMMRVDGDFMQGFDQRLRQGLCPPHWVDLTFETLPKQGSVYLVMTGWILPTDTSLNIQIDQNDSLSPIEFPSVWVPDSKKESGWRQAIPFAGFPGGKTKTIVIDVTDAVDREDVRVRVRTSAQIYWDAAEIATQVQPAEFTTSPMSLLAASVGFHGFSRRSKPGRLAPETYDYQDAATVPRWPPLTGKLTRSGDCLELLGRWDDKMVVIGAGDEVRLSFAAPKKPPPTGWVRDFVMHNVGWDKDADLNTLAGQKTGPLPYRSMSTYPPPAAESDQSRKRDELNRDHLQREQSFRKFWHRPIQP
ncbi:FG-GAP repeat domain-containing protein [Rubripirellula reticaptiva]|uniref:FG-GAP repeat protein n=1 Tax=Rubripirellula reticaptiva TaxID=2528013 RepID=A0A5C6F7S6_9BACT|nr:VCBS repeat-containing protein [Rubripirellula reticaptiva]TWU56136.1 hypothetical protein Poly59_24400 [Rubripirellula reticaptiva]